MKFTIELIDLLQGGACFLVAVIYTIYLCYRSVVEELDPYEKMKALERQLYYEWRSHDGVRPETERKLEEVQKELDLIDGS